MRARASGTGTSRGRSAALAALVSSGCAYDFGPFPGEAGGAASATAGDPESTGPGGEPTGVATGGGTTAAAGATGTSAASAGGATTTSAASAGGATTTSATTTATASSTTSTTTTTSAASTGTGDTGLCGAVNCTDYGDIWFCADGGTNCKACTADGCVCYPCSDETSQGCNHGSFPCEP